MEQRTACCCVRERLDCFVAEAALSPAARRGNTSIGLDEDADDGCPLILFHSCQWSMIALEKGFSWSSGPLATVTGALSSSFFFSSFAECHLVNSLFGALIMRRVYARAFFLSKFCFFRFTAAVVLI